MTKKLFAALVFTLIATFAVQAQKTQLTSVFDSRNIVKTNLSQPEIDKIIKAFSAKESEFFEALKRYSFHREVTIQSLGFGGQISGEYRLDSNLTILANGSRQEKILFAPISTLTDFTIGREDIEDLNGVNQFALEPSKINQYAFTFLGKEKIDELDLYVFDVAPKVMPNPKKSKERFFQGRVWIDDKDLQIVKTQGKGVPEDKNSRYPVVEIYREQIDGKYWFPTYSYANDDLIFDSAPAARIKIKIKYSDYKEAQTDVKILDDDTVVEETKPVAKPTATPSPTPKKP